MRHLLVVIVGVSVASPGVAHANGLYTHAHISQLAYAELPPGPIRTLLDDPEMQAACEAGSIFPDSGYAVSPAYGEPAHWEPLRLAFLASLQRRYAGDFSSREAQREIAFLLGMASHGLADESYDTTLLRRSLEVNPEVAEFGVDTYADYFLTIDQGVSFTVEPWAPWMHLPPLFAGMGVSPDEALLMEGMDLAALATELQGNPIVADAGWCDAWESYPFLGTHIYNAEAVGSLPWLGSLVAHYWQVLWARIHGTANVDADLVFATVPPDGGENWPIAPADSEALFRVGVWFGWGMPSDETIRSMRMVDATGTEVPVSFATAYGGRERSLIFVIADDPLDYDAVYTVEVDAGVRTMGGEVSTQPFMFSFRTRCAPDRLMDCPPLTMLEAGEKPMRPTPPARDAGEPAPDAGAEEPPAADDSGCGCTAPGSGPFGGWLVVGVVALALSRRVRSACTPGRW